MAGGRGLCLVLDGRGGGEDRKLARAGLVFGNESAAAPEVVRRMAVRKTAV